MKRNLKNESLKCRLAAEALRHRLDARRPKLPKYDPAAEQAQARAAWHLRRPNIKRDAS